MNLKDCILNPPNKTKLKQKFVITENVDNCKNITSDYFGHRKNTSPKPSTVPSSASKWGSACISVITSSSSRKSTGSKNSEQSYCKLIVALTEGRGQARCEVGITAISISNPNLVICQLSDAHNYTNTLAKINVFNPTEIIFPNTFGSDNRLILKVKEQFPNIKYTGLPRSTFNKINALDMLSKLCIPSMNGIVLVIRDRYYALAAASALLTYIQDSLYVYYAAGSLKIDYQESEGHTLIDVATADRLELVCSAKPARANKYSSLFGTLNHCYTKIGARALRSLILQPPSKVEYIKERLQCVDELIKNRQCLSSLQIFLQKLYNIDSLLTLATMVPDDPQKCSVRQLNYMLNLNSIIDLIKPLKELLKNMKEPFFRNIKETLNDKAFIEIQELVREVVNEDAQPAKGPLAVQSRCFAIKPGCNELLDVVRKIYSERINDMTNYVKILTEKYDLPFTLNNNLKKGFHLILTLNKTQRRTFKKSDLPEEFIEVQCCSTYWTMKTPDLVNFSTRVDDIVEDILSISNEIVYSSIVHLKKHIHLFYAFCEGIAQLDIYQSLAQSSLENSYIRPEFANFTNIVFGQHPLLNFLLPSKPVPNSTFCSDDYNVNIITGPNGSGKSIFIRQVMLLQIMAQIGSYVPAEEATFKPVNKMFARIYLDDNMECNASSFVLEVKELMYIMNTMQNNSLVIIDELCRSTSVEEGMCLAIAIIEKLACFSSHIYVTTHFTMLSKISSVYPNIKTWQMETISHGDDPKTFKLDYKYVLIPGITKVQRYGVYIVRNIWPDKIVEDVYDCLDRLGDQQPKFLFTPMDEKFVLKYNTESEIRLLKDLGLLTVTKIKEILIEYQMALKSLNYNVSFLNPEYVAENYEPSITSQEIELQQQRVQQIFTPEPEVRNISFQSGMFNNSNQSISSSQLEHNSNFLHLLYPQIYLNESQSSNIPSQLIDSQTLLEYHSVHNIRSMDEIPNQFAFPSIQNFPAISNSLPSSQYESEISQDIPVEKTKCYHPSEMSLITQCFEENSNPQESQDEPVLNSTYDSNNYEKHYISPIVNIVEGLNNTTISVDQNDRNCLTSKDNGVKILEEETVNKEFGSQENTSIKKFTKNKLTSDIEDNNQYSSLQKQNINPDTGYDTIEQISENQEVSTVNKEGKQKSSTNIDTNYKNLEHSLIDPLENEIELVPNKLKTSKKSILKPSILSTSTTFNEMFTSIKEKQNSTFPETVFKFPTENQYNVQSNNFDTDTRDIEIPLSEIGDTDYTKKNNGSSSKLENQTDPLVLQTQHKQIDEKIHFQTKNKKKFIAPLIKNKDTLTQENVNTSQKAESVNKHKTSKRRQKSLGLIRKRNSETQNTNERKDLKSEILIPQKSLEKNRNLQNKSVNAQASNEKQNYIRSNQNFDIIEEIPTNSELDTSKKSLNNISFTKSSQRKTIANAFKEQNINNDEQRNLEIESNLNIKQNLKHLSTSLNDRNFEVCVSKSDTKLTNDEKNCRKSSTMFSSCPTEFVSKKDSSSSVDSSSLKKRNQECDDESSSSTSNTLRKENLEKGVNESPISVTNTSRQRNIDTSISSASKKRNLECGEETSSTNTQSLRKENLHNSNSSTTNMQESSIRQRNIDSSISSASKQRNIDSSISSASKKRNLECQQETSSSNTQSLRQENLHNSMLDASTTNIQESSIRQRNIDSSISSASKKRNLEGDEESSSNNSHENASRTNIQESLICISNISRQRNIDSSISSASKKRNLEGDEGSSSTNSNILRQKKLDSSIAQESPISVSNTSKQRNLDSSAFNKRNLQSKDGSLMNKSHDLKHNNISKESPLNVSNISRQRNTDTSISSASKKRNLEGGEEFSTSSSNILRQQNIEVCKENEQEIASNTSKHHNLDSSTSSTSKKRNLDGEKVSSTSISEASRQRNLDCCTSTPATVNRNDITEKSKSFNHYNETTIPIEETHIFKSSFNPSINHYLLKNLENRGLPSFEFQNSRFTTSTPILNKMIDFRPNVSIQSLTKQDIGCYDEITVLNEDIVQERKPFSLKLTDDIQTSKTTKKKVKSNNINFVPPMKLTAKQIKEEFGEQDRKLFECSPNSASKYLQQRINRPSVHQIQNSTHLGTFRKTSLGFKRIPAKPQKRSNHPKTITKTFSKEHVDMTMFSDRNAQSFEQFINSNETDFRNFHFNKQNDGDNQLQFSFTEDNNKNKLQFSFKEQNENFDFFGNNSSNHQASNSGSSRMTLTPNGYYKENKECVESIISKYIRFNKDNLFENNNLNNDDYNL